MKFLKVPVIFILVILCSSQIIVKAQDENSFLIAHYKLDGNLADEKGLSNGVFADGNYAPSLLENYIDGYDGTPKGALLFGGSSNTWFRVDLGNFSPVQMGTEGEMTVSFWAYWNGSTGSWQDIINKRDTWTEDGMVWGINQHAATGNMLSLRRNGYDADSDVGMPVGEWTHVAVAADGVNAYFFVNGKLEDTQPYTYGTKYDAMIHAGTSPNGAIDAYNGALDDIRFYSCMLTETDVMEIMSPGTPRVMFIFSPDTVLINENVHFNASGSYDEDGEIVRYDWDFGDCEFDSSVTVSHAFNTPGDYSIKLTVTDNEGKSVTRNQILTVYSGAPFADFIFIPHFPLEDENVSFNGSSSWDVDGTIVNYQWDFANGQTDTGMSITHSFSTAGDYSVTLIVTDNDGKVDSLTKSLTVYKGSEPVRILPLGNSVTQSNKTHTSYRYNLWKKLIDGGYNFDFVGSQNTNYEGNPDWPDYQGKRFDPDHEGHWGWRADQIVQNLPQWLNEYTVDVVLLHIGSEDCNQNNSTSSTVNEIKQIIDILRSNNPQITILLARLIPWNDPSINDRIDDLNAQMDHIAEEKTSNSSPVIVIDQNTGFDEGADTFDGIHPDESGEEKMAATWYQALDLLLKKQASERPRIIATTDGEYDDQCSMIRFLLYTNEWDVEGIIYSSSKFHWAGHSWAGTNWIQKDIDLYRQVYGNLKQHDPDYPSPEYLMSKVFTGNIDNVGEMTIETPGSNLIVDVLLDSDPGPVWVQAWGGTNTIARALKSIQENYPEKMDDVSKKAIIYIILDQDNTYKDYIKPNWPDLPVLYSQSQFAAIAYSWSDIIPQPYHSYFETNWMKENITESHGPLCSNYPSENFGSEGDTPSFLHNIPVGLRQMEHPTYGGWGGRFDLKDSSFSQWWGAKDDGNVFKPVYRWSDAFQNDFAARADWCIYGYSEANHRPDVQIAGELDREVTAGSTVFLSATGTTDPDGDNLAYEWWQYGSADGINTNISISQSTNRDSASFIVPNEGGKNIHIILTVTDDGSPSLKSYKRIIFKITEGASIDDKSSSFLPDKFLLENNYPNPFNAVTKLCYSIHISTHVNLDVFDINGRKVSELVNKNQDAGRYEVVFEPKKLASGIYFYRFKAGSFLEYKRMLLLK